jgi:hypothetical protein
MANREIAVVKWKNRQYCVIKYDYKQPGLYFGIVLLCTCDKQKVGDYAVSESWFCDLVVRGFIKFIGNYESCMAKFSEFSAQLFGADFKSAEMSLKKPATIASYFVASSEEAKPTVRKVFTTSMELFEQQNQMSIARYFGSDYHLLGRRH